ncbi:MAG: exosome complex protein Rrp42 [Halobacteriota archaeon]|nr:exosome complex protein Rrp42 [Halobacteriota archaeon]
MDAEIITEIQKDYMYTLIKRGERIDGRALDEYRPISIETGLIDKAEGSARVRIGDSQVLVGVKIQTGEPFPDTPDKGVIITNAELVPLASPSFETGPPNPESVELARVVDRGVRESGAIDLSKLCIEEGEKVWMIFIDIHILDHDGNLIDAAALGAIAALLTTKIPKKRYGLGEEDEDLSVKDIPVAVTAIEFEGEIILDPNQYEEKIASSKITAISNTDGALSGMQMSGIESLDEETVNKMVGLAIEKSKEIREKFLEI